MFIMDMRLGIVSFLISSLFTIINCNLNSISDGKGNFNHLVIKTFDPPSPEFLNTQLAKDSRCTPEINIICKGKKTNLQVLMCLQEFQTLEEAGLNTECRNLVWNYKLNLTLNDNFVYLHPECRKEFQNAINCYEDGIEGHGNYLTCLLEEKNFITKPACQLFLSHLGPILLSNFRHIDRFSKACVNDMDRLQCDKYHDGKNPSFAQGAIIECLTKSHQSLSNECKSQFFKVKELQGSEFSFDRTLFFDCEEDRLRFCANVHEGQGRIIKCLMRHKFERTMSAKCKLKLRERQKLISEDYKISKKLAHKCRHEINENLCRSAVTKSKIKVIKLSQILLCLENAKHEGREISSDCQAEMLDHREMIKSDYQLSPDLAANCHKEIETLCENSIEPGGKVIDCLLKHANMRTALGKNRVSSKCQRNLEDAMKVIDVGENWEADPSLKRACQQVVNVACKGVSGGEGRVLSCLMDHLDSNFMVEECSEKLLQIQYFIARDFTLDAQLYAACKKNAVKLCHAKDKWYEDPNNMNPERGRLVLSCLFRYAYYPMDDHRLTKGCAIEVKRVMAQRAVSVNLLPEIEEECLGDLSDYCVHKVQKEDEMECLQKNLNVLRPSCREAISKFTQAEEQDISLNFQINHVCKEVIQKYCPKIDNDEDGEQFQCLIEHKTKFDVKSDVKCVTAIEHFQLITLQDYHFNSKFRKECKKDIEHFCPNIKSKNDVIMCLSEIHTIDVLENVKNARISSNCQSQLRVEFFQKNENIKLNPILDNVCQEDEKRFCLNIEPGEGKILQCLKSHMEELKPKCHEKIFLQVKMEMINNAGDYTLIMSCKRMIKLHCADKNDDEILECLKDVKDDDDMDAKCRRQVVSRMIMQSRDYRLNPTLQKACIRDIPKFCSKIKGNGPHEEEYEGKVIQCLKDQFRKHRLSQECELEIRDVIKNAALDYRQDPLLVKACKVEIKELCLNERSKTLGEGAVEECLKKKFEDNEIHNENCKKEIARILHESHSDIHSDPLLYRACALDVKHYCVNVPRGESRQLSCLLSILSSKQANLMPECFTMLSKRKEMYEMAVVVAPVESINEVLMQISSSPSRNYFLSVTLVVVGLIFILGLSFGRVTKRIPAMAKNK